MIIELPRSFTIIRWLDPEPSSTERPELREEILEYLKQRKVHYGLFHSNYITSIKFENHSDAVHFKLKMGAWEDQFRRFQDFGFYYAPYIPLQMASATGSKNVSFTFKTRYTKKADDT